MGKNDLVKTLRMNYLFDFYQTLLTEKQRNYMELFYLRDYSLCMKNLNNVVKFMTI